MFSSTGRINDGTAVGEEYAENAALTVLPSAAVMACSSSVPERFIYCTTRSGMDLKMNANSFGTGILNPPGKSQLLSRTSSVAFS